MVSMRPGAFPNFLWLVCQAGDLKGLGGQLGTSRYRQYGEESAIAE